MILDWVFVCIHLILPTPWNSIIEDMPCFLVYAAGTVVLNTKLVIIIHSHLLLFAPLISEEFPYQFPWGCFQIKEKLATTPHRIPQSQIKCGAARLFVKYSLQYGNTTASAVHLLSRRLPRLVVDQWRGSSALDWSILSQWRAFVGRSKFGQYRLRFHSLWRAESVIVTLE